MILTYEKAVKIVFTFLQSNRHLFRKSYSINYIALIANSIVEELGYKKENPPQLKEK